MDHKEIQSIWDAFQSVQEKKLSAKQKELDVDNDGDIEGDDLAALRNNKKKLKRGVTEKSDCPKCNGKGCDHCDGKGVHEEAPADPVKKAPARKGDKSNSDSSDLKGVKEAYLQMKEEPEQVDEDIAHYKIHRSDNNGRTWDHSPGDSYVSLSRAKEISGNMKHTGQHTPGFKVKITKHKKPKLAGPVGKLPESVEQVDEASRKKMKIAGRDVVVVPVSGSRSEFYYEWKRKDGKKGYGEFDTDFDKSPTSLMAKEIKAQDKKDGTGSYGRHNESVEQVDELKTSTLGSYLKKSKQSEKDLAKKTDALPARHPDVDKSFGKELSRMRGQNRATRSLIKKAKIRLPKDSYLRKEDVEQTDEGIISTGIAKVKAGHYDRKANKSFKKAKTALKTATTRTEVDPKLHHKNYSKNYDVYSKQSEKGHAASDAARKIRSGIKKEDVEHIEEGPLSKAALDRKGQTFHHFRMAKSDKGSKYLDKKQKDKNAEINKNDPKMAKFYGRNMVDTDKAVKKAGKKGLDKDKIKKTLGWRQRNSSQKSKLPEEVELRWAQSLAEMLSDISEKKDEHTKGATESEKYDSKFSKGAKDFVAMHQKSDKEMEDKEQKGHDDVSKAGRATKASAGRGAADQLKNGDKSVVKPVSGVVTKETK